MERATNVPAEGDRSPGRGSRGGERTRARMVAAAAALFRRHGYRNTTWSQVVAESGTPWGSIGFHFPGGKEELGEAALRAAGDEVAAVIDLVAGRHADPAEAVLTFFRESGRLMAASGYTTGCPVATTALEMSGTSERLRGAAREVFDRWQEHLAEPLVRRGLDRGEAAALATLVISAFEGALVLARVERSAAPLETAGAAVAEHVRRILASSPGQTR